LEEEIIVGLKIPEDVMEMLEKTETYKMVGTIDGADNIPGSINLDSVNTVKIVEKDTIAFSLSNEKRKFILDNLKDFSYLSLAVFEPAMLGFQLKGRLAGVAYDGDLLDSFKELSDEPKPFAVILMRVIEIYALTMAIAGEKVL
jgi:hypothetical protein